MTKTEIFTGVATAMVTPFKNGKIDYASLELLIERQIKAGISTLVIGGTTAEAATLSDKERYELFVESKKMISGRAKIIYGTGTNDTRVAINHTRYADKIGCDGALVVTPYYNKGTSEGIARHYESIANSCDCPIILYNVPSRTGVSLSIDTLERLSEHKTIVGLKEAGDSTDRLVAIAGIKNLALYSGNDSQRYTVLSLGGLGVISVVSNLFPEETIEICKYFFSNNLKNSLKIQNELLPVINALFLETNPAPIKYALSEAGLCLPDMRLPMWLPTKQTRDKIDKVISEYTAKNRCE